MITERMQQLAGVNLNEADMSQAEMSRYLKKMFKQKLGLKVKARSVKAKSKSVQIYADGVIPNDIRKQALVALYGNIPSGVMDMDDINYGVVRNKDLSLDLESWNRFVSNVGW